MGIGFPLGRLATTRHYDARSRRGAIRTCLDCRGQMHQASDRAKHTCGMIDQVDQLAQRGPPEAGNHSGKRRVIVSLFSNLHELDAASEVIDHGLEPAEMPPFDRVVVLATRHHNPIRQIQSDFFCNRRWLRALGCRKVDVPPKGRRPHARSQLLVEMLNKTPKEMQGDTVGLVDQRVVTIDNADLWVFFAQRGQVRVVCPQIRAASAHIGCELAWMTQMQITHSGGQHQDIARRL